MATFLLVVIYMAFISLGLPDALLGSAWPVMHLSLSVSLGSAGILSVITSIGTILSSFISGKVIGRFGTGKVTLVSVFLTAFALLGFSLSPNIWFLMVMAIPLGLGAGSVDAALNNFVALHYEARHMNWLHSFWGVGATLGPMIMALSISRGESWKSGYKTVAIIQLTLVAVLFLTLPLWKRFENNDGLAEKEEQREQKAENAFRIPGVKYALLAFFSYTALESTTGLWGSSYLVLNRGITPEDAARFISLYYGGITLGRFVTGFITMRFKSRSIIRTGLLLVATGVLFILLPLPNNMAILGLILIGLGCAPVFPGMIHETPVRFGKANSQGVIGIQMAFAYMGNTFMPALFGLLGGGGRTFIFPFYLLVLVGILLFASERINRMMKRRRLPVTNEEKLIV